MSKVKSSFQKMLGAAKKIRDENESKGTFEKIDWFIPRDGKVRFRLLPNPKDADQFFWKQIQTHFMPLKKKNGQMTQIPVRCLTDFEEICPLCSAFAKLSKSKDEEQADAAGRLKPVTRYLVNVVVYDDEKGTAKVQPYAMQSSVFDAITSIMDELQTVAYDLEEGRDLKLIRRNKGGRTEYQVLPVAAASAVPNKLRPLLKAAPDLDDLYTENEGARMKEYLEAVGFDSDDDEEVKAKPDKKTLKKKAPAKEVDEDEEEEDDEDDDDDVEEEDDDAEEEDEDDEEEDEDDEEEDDAEESDDDDSEDSDDDEEEDDEDEDEEEDEKSKSKVEESPRDRAAKAKEKIGKKKVEPPVKKKPLKSGSKTSEMSRTRT